VITGSQQIISRVRAASRRGNVAQFETALAMVQDARRSIATTDLLP
jgi:hypothetical protein